MYDCLNYLLNWLESENHRGRENLVVVVSHYSLLKIRLFCLLSLKNTYTLRNLISLIIALFHLLVGCSCFCILCSFSGIYSALRLNLSLTVLKLLLNLLLSSYRTFHPRVSQDICYTKSLIRVIIKHSRYQILELLWIGEIRDILLLKLFVLLPKPIKLVCLYFVVEPVFVTRFIKWLCFRVHNEKNDP